MKDEKTMNADNHTSYQILTLAERRAVREFQKTKQFYFCKNLLACLDGMLPKDKGAISDITIMMLLDALGIEGLSLTIADDASHTFVKLLEEQA